MLPADRVVQTEFDRRHQKARLAVEDLFNQQVMKFRLSDHFQSHKITVNSRSNWNTLRCLWDLQSLFFNLFTCLSGSQVTGVLGVAPPTLQEYLYSCNQGLLINQPFEDAEEELERNNDFF